MEAPHRKIGLPKSSRLTQRRDFLHLRSEGKRAAHGCLIANWRTCPNATGSRLGVVTSKQLGNAVTRSRARRLLREAFRLNRAGLRIPIDLVLVARRGILNKSCAEVQVHLAAVFRRAGLLHL